MWVDVRSVGMSFEKLKSRKQLQNENNDSKKIKTADYMPDSHDKLGFEFKGNLELHADSQILKNIYFYRKYKDQI